MSSPDTSGLISSPNISTDDIDNNNNNNNDNNNNNRDNSQNEDSFMNQSGYQILPSKSTLLQNFRNNEVLFDNMLLYPSPKPSMIANFVNDPVTGEKNVMVNGTIEALITQLTSPEIIDYQFLLDFFLTFRSFVDPLPLMELLLCRLAWCLKNSNIDTISENTTANDLNNPNDMANLEQETQYKRDIGKLALIRTFVCIRHWLLNHFQDDFVSSPQLRKLFTEVINELPNIDDYIVNNESLESTNKTADYNNNNINNHNNNLPLQAKIIINLKKVYLKLCQIYWNTISFDKMISSSNQLFFEISPYPSMNTARLSILGLKQLIDPHTRRSGILSLLDQRSSSGTNQLLKEYADIMKDSSNSALTNINNTVDNSNNTNNDTSFRSISSNIKKSPSLQMLNNTFNNSNILANNNNNNNNNNNYSAGLSKFSRETFILHPKASLVSISNTKSSLNNNNNNNNNQFTKSHNNYNSLTESPNRILNTINSMNLPKSSTIENLYSNVLKDFKSTPLQGVKLLSIPEFESDFSTLGFSVNGKVQMYKESKVKDITPNTPLKTMKLNLESCDNLRLNTPFSSTDDLNNKGPLKNITNVNNNKNNITGNAKNLSNHNKPVNNTQNKNTSNTNTNMKSNTQINSRAHSNDKGLFKELKSLFHNKNKNKKSTNVNNTNNTTAVTKTSNKSNVDKTVPSKDKIDINEKETDNSNNKNNNVFQKPRAIKDTDNNIFFDKTSDSSIILNSNSKTQQNSKNLEIIINNTNENQNKSDLLASRSICEYNLLSNKLDVKRRLSNQLLSSSHSQSVLSTMINLNDYNEDDITHAIAIQQSPTRSKPKLINLDSTSKFANSKEDQKDINIGKYDSIQSFKLLAGNEDKINSSDNILSDESFNGLLNLNDDDEQGGNSEIRKKSAITPNHTNNKMDGNFNLSQLSGPSFGSPSITMNWSRSLDLSENENRIIDLNGNLDNSEISSSNRAKEILSDLSSQDNEDVDDDVDDDAALAISSNRSSVNFDKIKSRIASDNTNNTNKKELKNKRSNIVSLENRVSQLQNPTQTLTGSREDGLDFVPTSPSVSKKSLSLNFPKNLQMNKVTEDNDENIDNIDTVNTSKRRHTQGSLSSGIKVYAPNNNENNNAPSEGNQSNIDSTGNGISFNVISRHSHLSTKSYLSYDSDFSVNENEYLKNPNMSSSIDVKLKKKGSFTNLRVANSPNKINNYDKFYDSISHMVVDIDIVNDFKQLPFFNETSEGNFEVEFDDGDDGDDGDDDDAKSDATRKSVHLPRSPGNFIDITDGVRAEYSDNEDQVNFDDEEEEDDDDDKEDDDEGVAADQVSMIPTPTQSLVLPYLGFSAKALAELANYPQEPIDCDPIEAAMLKLKGQWVPREKLQSPKLNAVKSADIPEDSPENSLVFSKKKSIAESLGKKKISINLNPTVDSIDENTNQSQLQRDADEKIKINALVQTNLDELQMDSESSAEKQINSSNEMITENPYPTPREVSMDKFHNIAYGDNESDKSIDELKIERKVRDLFINPTPPNSNPLSNPSQFDKFIVKNKNINGNDDEFNEEEFDFRSSTITNKDKLAHSSLLINDKPNGSAGSAGDENFAFDMDLDEDKENTEPSQTPSTPDNNNESSSKRHNNSNGPLQEIEYDDEVTGDQGDNRSSIGSQSIVQYSYLPKPIISKEKLLFEYRKNKITVEDIMKDNSHTPFVLCHSSKSIAEQFTLIERDALMEVDWKEVLEMSWSQHEATRIDSWLNFVCDENHPGGIELIVTRFNLISNWVISQILLCKDLDIRVLTISRFIHIALHCKNIQNYSTMFQIVLALTSNIVKKLKNTWRNVHAGDLLILKSLKDTVSPEKNFLNLRKELSCLIASKGVIPFLALHLSDLIVNAERETFISNKLINENDEFDPEKLLNEEQLELQNSGEQLNYNLINLSKFKTISKILKTILRLIDWSRLYDFKVNNDILPKCLYVNSLNEDEMNYCFSQIKHP
ncbi:hypothetical protein B5S32_g2761 [[Candida] boidinii]|nr:hypothetical protein B5S32_g2761 [[Candida] boidinii]